MGSRLVQFTLAVGVAVAGSVLAVGITFVIGMRSNWPPVVDTVRRFNRRVTNRRVLQTAGQPGASAAVIRHVGRVSGRPYETPIGPFAIDDGFAIALPYGTRADWVRNVLAAGHAGLVHDGTTYRLVAPEVVRTSSVADQLPSGERRLLRAFNTTTCLRARAVRWDAVSEPGAPA